MTANTQFLVFFDADSAPISMPVQIKHTTDADAALESVPDGTCYHGIYKLNELKRIGYSDIDIENIIEV